MNQKISSLIKLEKPLVIFDIETTGLSLTADRIIEIGYCKIFPDGREKEEAILFNPEISISQEASAIHGYTNEMLAGSPVFSDKAQEIWTIFHGCFFGGYNIQKFDLPFMKREFARVGMDFHYLPEDIVDSKAIMQYLEPRTLANAYRHYTGKELKGNHRAGIDTLAAKEILESQLERYRELRDWDFINFIHKRRTENQAENTTKIVWKKGEAHFAFSKYEGVSVDDVARRDPGFLRWILSSDFSAYVKCIAERAYRRIWRAKDGRQSIRPPYEK